MIGTLRIQPSRHALREAVAWFIPGDDPRTWLAAAATMGRPLEALRVLIVPCSLRDRGPRGAVLASADGRPLPRPEALCEAYGIEAGSLYLPTHARLLPAVSTQECRELLPAGAAVFHPLAGLVVFEAGDSLTALDLVQPPPPVQATWDRAQPGVTLSPHLRAVMPDAIPTLEQIDRDLRGDMGTQPLSDLPPHEDEPRDSPVRQAGRAVARGFLRLVRGIARSLSRRPSDEREEANPRQEREPRPGQTAPAGGGGRTGGTGGGAGGGLLGGLGHAVGTFFASIAEWAGRAMESFARASPHQRERELERLQRMLDEDPAEALKYAIPIVPGGAGRGIAPPSNRLGPRDTNFNLSSLGGGGPVDAWEVSWEQQQALMKRYRELAMAEARMGRHRRAAYIFATLLGDLDAAAKVLVEGCYFREAAAIYRDRLNRPEAAARCLEQGGLLLEAAQQYLDLAQWLEAARLYRKLGREDDARKYILCEVERRRDRGDHVAASELLERDLGDVEAALAMLRLGLDMSQRFACMQRLTDTFARLGRHRDASALVAQITRGILAMGDACQIATLLADNSASYPDRAVSEGMREAVLRLASDHLPETTEPQAQRLTAALAQLAPRDRLLGRDGQRFTQSRTPTALPPAAPHPRERRVVSEMHAFSLPVTAEHMVGASVGKLFYVAAWSSTGMSLVRGDTKGNCDVVVWAPGAMHPGHGEEQQVGLHVGQHEEDDLLITPISSRWKPRFFAARDDCPGVRCLSPDWLPPFTQTLAISTAAPGSVWALVSQEASLSLNAYSRQGALLHSTDLRLEEVLPDSPEAMVPRLYARPRMVVLGLGDHLSMHVAGASPRTIHVGQPILSIVGAAPFARNRFALLHAMGATIVWAWDTQHSFNSLAQDMAQPIGAFTHNSGLLVLAAAGECRIWSTSRDQLSLLQTLRWPQRQRQRPVAVLPIEPGDDFLIVFQSGQTVHYQVAPPQGARW